MCSCCRIAPARRAAATEAAGHGAVGAVGAVWVEKGGGGGKGGVKSQTPIV